MKMTVRPPGRQELVSLYVPLCLFLFMLVSDCKDAQQQENKQWSCWSRTSVLILRVGCQQFWMPVWLHAELNVQHSGQRRHVAVLAAAGGLSPTIPLLSPRRSSNLTCPSFLYPPFRPRLPTQWTVPTTACCQCTHTRRKNTKQRGQTFAGASTQEIRLPSPAWDVCQPHSFTYIFMLLWRMPSRRWQNDSAATSPWSFDGSEYRVTQQPANHSMHQPLKCTHYRAAFAFQ